MYQLFVPVADIGMTKDMPRKNDIHGTSEIDHYRKRLGVSSGVVAW